MDFCAYGFAKRKNKRATKRSSKDKEEEEEEERRWAMTADGRLVYIGPRQHGVPAQWVYPGYIAPGMAHPPPLAAGPFAPWPPVARMPVTPPVMSMPVSPVPYFVPVDLEEKKKDKKKKRGTWQESEDDDGYRCWEHSETKKIIYRDPFY